MLARRGARKRGSREEDTLITSGERRERRGVQSKGDALTLLMEQALGPNITKQRLKAGVSLLFFFSHSNCALLSLFLFFFVLGLHQTMKESVHTLFVESLK